MRGEDSALRTEIKSTKLPKARENMGDRIVIGFSFTSDWLKEWCKFSGRITRLSEAKPI